MELKIILVFSMILAGVITHTAALLTFIRYKSTNNHNLLYVVMNWLCYGFCWYLTAIGHILGDVRHHQAAYILQIIGAYFLLFFIDLNSRKKIDPIKITILTIIATMYLYSMFLPEIAKYNEGYGLHFIGLIRTMQIIYGTFYNFLNFYWIVKIYRNSPPNLKENKGKALLIGGVIMNVIPMIWYYFATFWLPMGAFTFLIHAIGILIVVFVVKNEPKLLFILTFRAHQLIIISRVSGLKIYEHKWTDKKFGHSVLSSLIHAIITISNKVLSSGDLDEFSLQKGSVILKHSDNYSIVLIANNQSNYLNTSLEAFAQDFYQKYSQMDLDEKNGIKMDDFNFADELINKHFASIPSWIEK